MPNLSSSNRRALLTLLACLGLALPLLVAQSVTQSATAASPSPVRIVIDQISSGVAAPDGTPLASRPTVLVQAGGTISIDVSFYDVSGDPASFNTDTTLAISTSAGTPSPSTGTAFRNEVTAHLTTSVPSAANQVSLTVSVAGGRGARTVTPGTSSPDQLFDVVSELRTEKSSDNFAQGIGGDSNCADATRQDPVCGIVILPKGAASDVLLSIGACDATSYTPCSTKGAVVQTLFADGGLYSTTNPATLLMKCDKTRCGTGAIQNTPAWFSSGGNDPLEQVPACPAKNTVGEDQQMCVDWVQSKRDGSGDTYLYLLFIHDMRAGVG